MRYLKEDIFTTAVGGPFAISHVKGTERDTTEATISELLCWLISNYRPDLFMQYGQIPLNNADLRRYNRVIDILEGEPQEEGCYRFEDADFEILKRVALFNGPLLSPRNSPLVEDILNAALDRLPEEAAAGSPIRRLHAPKGGDGA